METHILYFPSAEHILLTISWTIKSHQSRNKNKHRSKIEIHALATDRVSVRSGRFQGGVCVPRRSVDECLSGLQVRSTIRE